MKTVQEQLARFIGRRHVSVRSPTIGPFITCFDKDANEVPFEIASAGWPRVMHGQLEGRTPEAGNGHYAHLRFASQHADVQLGGSKRYELIAPDWSVSAHVTEPRDGAAPDVIVEDMTSPTDGMLHFARCTERR